MDEKLRFFFISLGVILIPLLFVGYLFIQAKDVVDVQKNTDKFNEKKNLVLYFSVTGNTKKVAYKLKDYVHADIKQIETKKVYPTKFEDLKKVAAEEQSNNSRPSLKKKYDISKYDVIFVGCPVWFQDMPMAMYTLFDTTDFSNKIIIPFVTCEETGLGEIPNKIQLLEKDSYVTGGLSITDTNAVNLENKIEQFIANVKLEK